MQSKTTFGEDAVDTLHYHVRIKEQVTVETTLRGMIAKKQLSWYGFMWRIGQWKLTHLNLGMNPKKKKKKIQTKEVWEKRNQYGHEQNKYWI